MEHIPKKDFHESPITQDQFIKELHAWVKTRTPEEQKLFDSIEKLNHMIKTDVEELERMVGSSSAIFTAQDRIDAREKGKTEAARLMLRGYFETIQDNLQKLKKLFLRE